MDYTHIMEELDKATLFDLYRLQVAINSELDSQKRIQKVKTSLRVGEEITWLDETINRLEKAVVRKILKTRCEIRNFSDNKIWKVSYDMLQMTRDIEAKLYKQKEIVKQNALQENTILDMRHE